MMKNTTLLCINKDVGAQIGQNVEVTETYLLCPSCQKFVWHKSCLESICKEFKMSVPNLNSAKWKCPNCV